jgi:hypothetical protein
MNSPVIARTLFVAMIAIALAPVSAKDQEKAAKPKENEVVIVARLLIDPPIDDAFFAHYATVLEKGIANIKIVSSKKSKGEAPSHSYSIFINKVGRAQFFQRNYRGGQLGDIGYLKCSIPKDRMLEISGMRVYIFGNPFLSFDFPIFHNIKLPEGVNYVYLGTFALKMRDEYFNISSISQIDEYDAAVKAVQDDFGTEANLVRVNLLEPEEKK